jgi:chloride channel protein, CIC family
VGAALSGLFCFGVNAVFPEFTTPVGAYAMVGMRSVVVGTTPATLQAIVMAPEMTKNYEMILPLALCCAI